MQTACSQFPKNTYPHVDNPFCGYVYNAAHTFSVLGIVDLLIL
ncbi:hypothetical protein J2X61_002904 [Bacillus sp. 3255]|nr:hypothetical protein [Bacillus sp. 3255]